MTDPWMVQNSITTQEINLVANGFAEPEIVEDTSHAPLEFEDNFTSATTPTPRVESTTPLAQFQGNQERSVESIGRVAENNSNEHQPLPDSDSYLRGLERKLQKIKKGSSLVEALAEKRNDCMRALLQTGDPDNNNAVLALEQPVNNSEFYRHLQPVQPLSVGELVHIVNYDQLEQQEPESAEPQEQQNEVEIPPKSSQEDTDERKK